MELMICGLEDRLGNASTEVAKFEARPLHPRMGVVFGKAAWGRNLTKYTSSTDTQSRPPSYPCAAPQTSSFLAYRGVKMCWFFSRGLANNSKEVLAPSERCAGSLEMRSCFRV